MARRQGFTLTEVALSMALVAVAVLSLFLVIPQGFKAQRSVRYQILAAAKAMELIDLLHTNNPGVIHNARDLDKEGVYPWDSPVAYAASKPDLETALEALYSVVKPLPEGIGRRLDSDGDEIAKLLDEGGRLYYFYPSDPAGAMMLDPDLARDRNWFDATKSLIVGVVGSAQQNSILYYPALKLGPYQAFYPSPPAHAPTRAAWNVKAAGWSNSGDTPLFCYDVTYDRRIGRVWMDEEQYSWKDEDRTEERPVLDADGNPVLDGDGNPQTTTVTIEGDTHSKHYGAAEYLYSARKSKDSVRIRGQDSETETDDERRARRARAVGYLVPCLWFAQEVGLDPLAAGALAAPPNGATDVVGAYDPSTSFDDYVETHSGPGDGSKVLAMRYLAHAGMCLVACHPDPSDLTATSGYPLGGGEGPLYTDVMTLEYLGEDWAEVRVTLDRIRAWHEASVRMAIRFADRAGPYDWGAPRPLNRQVMMDHPLVQLDLWSKPVKDHFPWYHGSSDTWDFPRERTYVASAEYPPQVVMVGSTPMEQRRQWKAVYGSQKITHPGRAVMFPGRVLDTNADGELDHEDLPIPDFVDGVTDTEQGAIGDPRHFNLTHAFVPAERTRELVFWSVDWQSYEDFESHPSAELDASRYPIHAPMPWDGSLGSSDAAARAAYAAFADGWLPGIGDEDPYANPYERLYKLFSPMPATHPWNRRSSNRRQLNVYGRSSVVALGSRNPEHVAIFELPTRRWNDADGAFTGAFYEGERPVISEVNDYGGINESKWQGDDSGPQQSVDITTPSVAADDKPGITDLLQHEKAYAWWNKFMNLGVYGANRDGQLTRRRVDLQSVYGDDLVGESGADWLPAKDMARIDRGTVPPTVRLHAATVARFMFYDPRISGGHFQ